MNVDALLLLPERRQHAVTFALALAHNTTLEPGAYELSLLVRFVAGELTLIQVECFLEAERGGRA